MCGILAVANLNQRSLDETHVLRMRDTMRHRGPDDAGLYHDDQVTLAHRRLSIIDLSESGHQPMSNEDGNIWLIFNGTIYNYLELCSRLKNKGHILSSTSDTEVIIHQYEEDGESCLSKFNGVFSFVLWDKRIRKLFAARDRAGIKPLYYYIDDKKLILASEIKAIIEDPSVPREPDYQAISDYFFAGRALAGKTVFKTIKEVMPGHYLTLDMGNKNFRLRKYWDLVFDYNRSREIDETREELFHLLDDAVKLHCLSDVPVGCHLSGGIDSSSVVGFASRHCESLQTFSIKFSDDPHIDETPHAKAVAQYVGAEYNENTPPAIDITRFLPFLIWHMDVPMATEGGFAYYTCSRFVSKHVKVVLTGHGGDEVFAGYPAQFQASFDSMDMFDVHSDPDRSGQRSFYRRLGLLLASRSPRRAYEAFKKRLIGKALSLEDKWIQLHCGSEPRDSGLFCDSFIEILDGYTPKDSYVEPFKEVAYASTLDKCLYHDLRLYLPGLLHLEDRASMAVSIESRVPLLDYRIIEYLATVPPEQKVKNLIPKYLLREVSSNLLPQSIVERRDKKPFPVPAKFWSDKNVRNTIDEVLLSKESLDRGIILPEILKRACARDDLSLPLWQLLNLELWFKLFVDRNPSWIDAAQLST